MATLVTRSRVVREIPAPGRGRNLMVTLAPEGIILREKGTRTEYLLPYGVAFVRGAALKADADRRAKAAARKERAARRVGR